MTEGFQKAYRLQKLPPYVFSRIAERKKELIKSGVDMIDLGMGTPDLAVPKPIIEVLNQKVLETENSYYAPYAGIPEFRGAVQHWMERRFSVSVDPDKEVLNLIGSKEGIANFTQAVVNPGDFVLIPDPGYPVYSNATILAGATPIFYPLRPENRFQPDWSEIDEGVWKSIRMIFINFPNNPTSATVEIDCYRELVDLAHKYNFIICSDNPYSEQSYDSLAPCLMQAKGAMDVAIESFSMSKTYNMSGWRIGFAVGNEKLIAALHHMKSTIDTGIFKPIQYAAAFALEGEDRELLEPSKAVYRYRRQFMQEGLSEKGYEVFDANATFYLWIRTPAGKDSMSFCEEVMQEGVVCTPGSGFGKMGEGFFRISLTRPEEVLKEALNRIPPASS